MLCLNCNLYETRLHPTLGYVNCDNCLNKPMAVPNRCIEFTTDSIREQRKAHFDDIHPFHNKGEASKEWIVRYGVKKAKQHGLTDKEIKIIEKTND